MRIDNINIRQNDFSQQEFNRSYKGHGTFIAFRGGSIISILRENLLPVIF